MTKARENVLQANESRRQAEVVLIADKAGFKQNPVRRDKGHFILIKRRIHQEGIWF